MATIDRISANRSRKTCAASDSNASELVQMLQKGHYGVKLDAEAWDRLITWIDLNCPFHGTWGEEIKPCPLEAQRRREMLKLYAGIDDDPEAVPARHEQPIAPVIPPPDPPANPSRGRRPR